MDGLLGLVAMGAVELHPWAATVDDIEHPDRLIFNLDPGPGITWEFVVETALLLRDMLKKEGLRSWPKLPGGKGLHVMVPVAPRISHDEARTYCRAFAERVARTAPDRYTLDPAPEQRVGRLYVDYLRNGRGNTAVGTYSPRVREGFPVAALVTWKDVEGGIASDAFSTARPPPRG